MKKHLYFGEKIEKYDTRVLNERELRAGGSIFLVAGIIAFVIACINGSYEFMGLFAIALFIDFAIRIVLNPKYSPTLIIGKIVTRNQRVDYIAATPKRFAWSIATALSLIIIILIVLDLYEMSTLAIASILLFFMFLEIAFGICIGCKIYAFVTRKKPHLCSGDACEEHEMQPIQHVNPFQIFASLLYIALIIWSVWLIAFPPATVLQ